MKKLLTTVLAAIGLAGAAAGIATWLERRAIGGWTDGPTPPERRVRGTESVVVTPDGARLRISRLGEGPLVVLAHGIGGSLDQWSPVAQDLVSHGYSVLAYDQRGHDQSSRGSAEFTTRQLGLDLMHIIASTDERPVVVAGHSMGGITIQAALELGLPDEVDSIVLIATTARAVRRTNITPSRRALDTFLKIAAHPTHGLLAMRGGFGRSAHRDDLEALRRNWTRIDGDSFADATAGLLDFDLTEVIQANRLPTRVIGGELDKVLPIELSAEIAALVEADAFERLEGIGHMIIWEAPDSVLSHILASAEAVRSAE